MSVQSVPATRASATTAPNEKNQETLELLSYTIFLHCNGSLGHAGTMETDRFISENTALERFHI